MLTRTLLLACFVVGSTTVFSAEQTHNAKGFSFKHPDDWDVSDQPKKDSTGSMINITGSLAAMFIAIESRNEVLSEAKANEKQIELESLGKGVKPSDWKPIKRKIGSTEREGKTVVDEDGARHESYAVVLGKQTLIISLMTRKGKEKEAEASYKMILESLK